MIEIRGWSSAEPENLGIFFLQLPSDRKNIFPSPIRKILGVLKSYESESFESGVLIPWIKFGVPPGSKGVIFVIDSESFRV